MVIITKMEDLNKKKYDNMDDLTKIVKVKI